MLRRHSSFCGIAAAALWAQVAAAQAAVEPPREFWDPIVETAPGRPSRVSESPSTTFVMTADEIRRSGATSVPELLRRVPGLDVRTMAATDGELGLRGFAFEVADRILVLVDGRTVYIDFFGGTLFEMLPISLVDIERIEVVLGPGASIYGNKAMLGTVNIITRSAADYPFAEARMDAGNPRDGRVGARYGHISGAWRVRASGVARRLSLFDANGRGPAGAEGGALSASYSPSAGAEASLELGAMNGRTYINPTGAAIDGFDATVGFLRARGRLGLGGPGAPLGDLNLDLVWNAGRARSATFPLGEGGFHAEYHTPYARLHHAFRTRILDVPMQARWGGEVRLNTLDSTITTGERPLWNVAAFASDEVLLGRWRLTTGLRVDRSTFTEVSFSPRVSVVWSPAERHQLRAAYNTGYNNAHLLHYFADLDILPAIPGVTPAVHVRGNPDLLAEHVRYGELGWNGGLTPWLRAFATAFAYRFEHWISLDPEHPTPDGSIPYGNNPPFNAYGGEVGIELSPRQAISGYASYAFMGPKGTGEYPYKLDAHGSPQHKVTAGVRYGRVEGMGSYATLDAQYFGRSAVARVSFPTGAGGCGRTTEPGAGPFVQTALDSFVMAHARIGYAFSSGLDLSLGASNLLDDRTCQFPGAEAPERRIAATVAYYR